MRRPAGKLDKIFGQRLRELRGDAPQLKFAKKLGIAQSTLNRIENCEQSVTLNMLELIAVKLKLRVHDLLCKD